MFSVYDLSNNLWLIQKFRIYSKFIVYCLEFLPQIMMYENNNINLSKVYDIGTIIQILYTSIGLPLKVQPSCVRLGMFLICPMTNEHWPIIYNFLIISYDFSGKCRWRRYLSYSALRFYESKTFWFDIIIWVWLPILRVKKERDIWDLNMRRKN